MRRIFSFLVWACSISFGLSQPHFDQIQPVLDSIRMTAGIPGMAVSLISLDTSIFRVSGTARAYQNDTLTIDRAFHLGSNTKAMTSFIAMKLVEQGKVSFDSKFAEVFPDWEEPIDAAYQTITLGQLLSHKARIPGFTAGNELNLLPPFSGGASQQRREFTEHVLTMAPADVGTYSNAGYVIAALMLEGATGLSFETLLANTMNEINCEYLTGFPNWADTLNPWGHFQGGPTLQSMPPQHEYHLPIYMLSAGDVSMSPPNYAKFIQLHLKGLNGEDNYLKAEHYRQLHFGLDHYSYGWANGNKRGHQISNHSGSAGTYFSHCILVPDAELAVVIMCNASGQGHIDGVVAMREWMLTHFLN